ncbi:MAG: PsbP-related protein [Candidatus Berkelbacteria bacterium]
METNQNPEHGPFWMWLVLLGVVLVGVGFFAWVNFGQNKTEVATPAVAPVKSTDTISPVSGWKTYTDADYGFSFKYPSDYPLRSHFNGSICLDKNLPSADLNEYCQNGSGLSTSVVDSKGESLVDYVNGWQSGRGPITDYKHDSIKIDGQDAIKVSSNPKVCDVNSKVNDTTIWTLKDNRIFTFSFNSCSTDVETFNKIISTFQFTTPVSTADWKTYENIKDGYSFKYPPMWTGGMPNWFKNTNPAYGVVVESNKTLQETIDYYTSPDQVFASAPFYKKTDTIFAGQKATQISYGYKGDDEIRIIIFQYNGKIFTITGYPKESLEQNGPEVNTFDLISATFKFIK